MEFLRPYTLTNFVECADNLKRVTLEKLTMKPEKRFTLCTIEDNSIRLVAELGI